MPKHLLIVESPAKAHTIGNYLGPDYRVLASVGHVRDLPVKSLGVDLENGYAPQYELSKGRAKVVAEIRAAAARADTVYLATDLDREGEAIAWHVLEAAGIDRARTRCITFDQITRAAIQQALQQPRDLDMDLIDAQQARRVLDRLVGYQISPLLSKALRRSGKRALSAGRVQSVALRLVVDREREILAFVPEEYWTLDAELQRRTAARERLTARLAKIRGQNAELHSRQDMDAVHKALEGATYAVTRVATGRRTRNPQPPFITSTLQAEAGRKLGWSPKQTMAVAQQLYEGVDLGDGEPVGLITYMRTDSAHVAAEAQAEARSLIADRWGADHLPARAPTYRARAGAQEAHEAIRPTSALREPEAIRRRLSAQQARLYDLIWRRFVASQMKPALYATLTVDITAAQYYLFRANGATLLFPGYLAVYEEGRDDAADEQDGQLPPLTEGELLDLIRLRPEQHYTQPPPRYSEPTLIKALEEHGVGRPSSYASIVTVIQEREYVVKQQGRLYPTPLGMVACDALVATFPDVMDLRYTADMEQQLDRVAQGALGYVPMLDGFYQAFSPELERAKKAMPEAADAALWAGLTPEARAMACPQCGKPLIPALSSAGRLLRCSGYPECRYLLDVGADGQPVERQVQYAEGIACEKCGGRMKVIQSGKDRFLGCENYPKCRNTRPILSEGIQQLAAESACPSCGHKPVEARKGRFGEYLRCPGCNANIAVRRPRTQQTGDAPLLRVSASRQGETVDIACPECGARPLEKRVGRFGPYYRCPACKKNTSAKKLGAAAVDAVAPDTGE